MKKLFFVFAFFAVTVHAACPELYAPGLKKPKTATELCNIFFVVAYDESGSRPMFVSERLKNGTPVGSIERVNAFRVDGRIKNSPENADYVKTGYDRGHLAPSANASTRQEQRATFLLTNMTPQVPTLNRESWRILEEEVRAIFYLSSTDVYVVNIPIYTKTPPLMMGVVPIPTGYWKIVISEGVTRAFYADNIFKAKVVEYTGINWKSLIR